MVEGEGRLLSTAKLDVEQFLEVLGRSSRGVLLLDYDGTLAPFTTERQRALPYRGVPALLKAIMNLGHTRVAVVTGRPASEIAPLLGIFPPPEIWGAYGQQHLKPNGACTAQSLDQSTQEALTAATQWLEQLHLSHLVESKPGSVAVHWRGLEDSEVASTRGRILLGWISIADRSRMAIQDFDGGIEMISPRFTKGSVVRALLAEIDPATPVAYLGDDEPDEDAFLALDHRGLRILVRSEWRETLADTWLRPPGELLQFLSAWLEACGGAQ